MCFLENNFDSMFDLQHGNGFCGAASLFACYLIHCNQILNFNFRFDFKVLFIVFINIKIVSVVLFFNNGNNLHLRSKSTKTNKPRKVMKECKPVAHCRSYQWWGPKRASLSCAILAAFRRVPPRACNCNCKELARWSAIDGSWMHAVGRWSPFDELSLSASMAPSCILQCNAPSKESKRGKPLSMHASMPSIHSPNCSSARCAHDHTQDGKRLTAEFDSDTWLSDFIGGTYPMHVSF